MPNPRRLPVGDRWCPWCAEVAIDRDQEACVSCSWPGPILRQLDREQLEQLEQSNRSAAQQYPRLV